MFTFVSVFVFSCSVRRVTRAYNNMMIKKDEHRTGAKVVKSIFNSLKEENQRKEEKTHLGFYVESKHIFYALWKIIVRDKRVIVVDAIDFLRLLQHTALKRFPPSPARINRRLQKLIYSMDQLTKMFVEICWGMAILHSSMILCSMELRSNLIWRPRSCVHTPLRNSSSLEAHGVHCARA